MVVGGVRAARVGRRTLRAELTPLPVARDTLGDLGSLRHPGCGVALGGSCFVGGVGVDRMARCVRPAQVHPLHCQRHSGRPRQRNRSGSRAGAEGAFSEHYGPLGDSPTAGRRAASITPCDARHRSWHHAAAIRTPQRRFSEHPSQRCFRGVYSASARPVWHFICGHRVAPGEGEGRRRWGSGGHGCGMAEEPSRRRRQVVAAKETQERVTRPSYSMNFMYDRTPRIGLRVRNSSSN